MAAVAVIFGLWGGLLGLSIVMTQRLALAFLAIPVASLVGGLVAIRNPTAAAILLGLSTFAWLLTGSLVDRDIDFLTVATMLLSGFGAFFAAHEPLKVVWKPQQAAPPPPRQPATAELPCQGAMESAKRP